jgi:hypothetical protein
MEEFIEANEGLVVTSKVAREALASTMHSGLATE